MVIDIRKPLVVSFLGFALLAGIGAFSLSRMLKAQTSEPAYWLEQVERATNQQTQKDAGKTRYFAQRADGSTARGVTNSDFSKVQELREIELLPERKRIVISDATKTVSTIYLSQQQFDFNKQLPRAASNKCMPRNWKGAEYLGEDSYSGFLVHK